MTEIETANQALDSIQLNAGEYETWLKIAMAYKSAAGNDGAEYFNAWNLKQPDNRGARDLKDYLQMKSDGGITVATLYQIAEQRGGFTLPRGNATPAPRTIKHAEPSTETATETDAPQWNRYKQGDPLFFSTTLKDAPKTRREQRRDFINSIFKSGDQITLPQLGCRGAKSFTLDELQQWAQTAREETTEKLEKINFKGLHDRADNKGGLFICINPTDGNGRSDESITEYRQTLIETDDTSITIPEQIDTLKKSGIPILTLTKTGGKSVHAVVYVGAGTDRDLYTERVEYLHKYLKERWDFFADPADKNPARLTRMAGFLRWDIDGNQNKGQELIATGTADSPDPWTTFYERAESLKATEPPTPLTELSLDELNDLKETATKKEAAEIDKIIKDLQAKKKWATSTRPRAETFTEAMEYYKNNPPTPTGLAALDDLLNGGILGDFYVLGGCSGMGKTTLALQIATTLARRKIHVFFYSYEQDRDSLTAKIIAQLGAELALANWGRAGLYEPTDLTLEDVKTQNGETVLIDRATRTRRTPPTREILVNGGKYFNEEERKTFTEALNTLDNITTLHIVEADRTYTAQKIADDAKALGRIFGYNKIAFFVDYLQKIPAEAGLTDKQALDTTTATLHEISRKHRVPIFSLSSLNRETYKGTTARAAEVTLASFKESGGIEYDTDAALGLQADGENDEERKNRLALLHGTGSINLRTTLLKSRRGGKLGEHATLEFFPAYDFFLTAKNETESIPEEPTEVEF